MESDDRSKLEMFLRKHETIKLDLPPISPDSTDSAYDYLVSESGQWIHWSSKVESFVYPTDRTPEYATLLVPSVSSVRTEYLVDLIAKQQKSVLLIGEPVSEPLI